MILYKYLSASRLGVLATQFVRFTPPSEFNDPYEALPCLSPPSREAAKRRIGPRANFTSLHKSASAFFVDRGPAIILSMISQEYGALCLAETSNDPLLWAHYADGHRGFAIGFDSDHSWFKLAANPHDPLLDDIQPVTYQSDRPVVPMIDPLERSEDAMRLQLRGMLFTKHNSWQHEAEWRLVRPLASATEVVRTPAGEVIHLFAYPAEAVCEVIVGARASELLKAEIVNLLATPPFKRVCLRRAALSRTGYLLDLDECSA